MRHLLNIDDASLEAAWLTIGSFDGVHRGHQGLIRRLVKGAHETGSQAVVLTFHPHPAVVLGRRNGPYCLTTAEERAALLGELGVDVVITQPFDPALAATSAADFMLWLKRRLGLRCLLIGHDFALGKGRQGDETALRALGLQMDFQVQAIEPLAWDGEVASSTAIRNWLTAGEVSRAGELLGRPYRLSGEVIPGDQRGRTIGVPTANLALDPAKILPAGGVYACRAWLGERSWAAAVNIGTRPTFDGLSTVLHLEAHLLDFQGDLYGQTLALDFVQRLRGEQRFSDIQALVAQIRQDIQATRQIILMSGK